MKSTQKILVAGLILMVLLNLCTLGYILFKPNRGGHGKYAHRMEGRHGHGKYFKQRLNLTPEQESSLEKLRAAHEEKMSAYKEKIEGLRKQRFELIKSDSFDAVKADQIALEIGNVHAEMEKQVAEHFLAIRALCTKEQLTGFNDFIDRISERMAGSEPERFGQHKRGPGF